MIVQRGDIPKILSVIFKTKMHKTWTLSKFYGCAVPTEFKNQCIPAMCKKLWIFNHTSTEQSPSWEANSSLVSQEFLRILWNRKVHCRIHNGPPPLSILNHINPIHVPPSTSWKGILKLSPNLLPGLPSEIFPSEFTTKTLLAPRLSPVRATRPVHLIFLDFDLTF